MKGTTTAHKRARGDARRTAIADAALALLAEKGGHGLTHLAVDAALALPPGSTSYYCNSRAALLTAAADALFSADKADIAALSNTDGDVDVEALMRAWSSPDARPRLLARIELFLEASRNPAFRAHLAPLRTYFLAATEAAMSRRGETDAASAAERAIAAFEGELLRAAAFGAP